MKIKVFILFVFSVAFIQAQNNSLVLNDDAYWVMNGGSVGTPVYTVINQSHANGIITTGTGGNILSEDEYNYMQWNISSSTGTYTVPLTTGVGAGESKIPYSMQITTAGSAGGNILFSTYETSDMNVPWASSITHMMDAATGSVDNSLFVVDRFWIIDASSYGTKPATTMSFGYNTDASETAGTNTLSVGNLGAQRFDSGTGDWDGFVWGTDNGSGTVSGAVITPGHFFRSWTLADKSSPLPVGLTFFKGQCDKANNILKWRTESEANNDYFLIEKSFDGTNYTHLDIVQGAGNSNATIDYSYTDYSASENLVFYKLTPIDFDGVKSAEHAISVESCESSSVSVYAPERSNEVVVNIQSVKNEDVELFIYDISGRVIKQNVQLNVETGSNSFMINVGDVAFGIYTVLIKGETTQSSSKIWLK